MEFSRAKMTLVAFAHVKGSDGSTYVSDGFKLTQGSAGYYQLFLNDELTQEPTDGKYPYVVTSSVSSGVSGSSNDGLVQTGLNGNQTITAHTLNLSLQSYAIDFVVMVWRPVFPPVAVATP